MRLEGKWAFGSPRDAVSLLSESPHSALKIRPAKQTALARHFNFAADAELQATCSLESLHYATAATKSGMSEARARARDGLNAQDSDSSDDEAWSSFVARGVRHGGLQRSLLDEAAGLNKTLAHGLSCQMSNALTHATAVSKTLTHSTSVPAATGPIRIAISNSGNENVMPSGGHSEIPQIISPHVASPGHTIVARKTTKYQPLPLDAHNDLQSLLDEVRRATDRCERRKRMMQLMDKNVAPARSVNRRQHGTQDTVQLVQDPKSSTFLHPSPTSAWSFRNSRQQIPDLKHEAHGEQGHGKNLKCQLYKAVFTLCIECSMQSFLRIFLKHTGARSC